MKHIRHKSLVCSFIITIFMLQGCGNKNNNALFYQDGVSYALAQARKAAISDIEYRLHFDIPEESSGKIEGNLQLNLNLNKELYKKDLVLDFKESPSRIRQIKINGEEARYLFENEHIRIPAKQTDHGYNTIDIRFTAGEQSLNRNEEYLYTLLVPDRARTLFPCFDQPDMKASYLLQLTLPAHWEAVGNSPCIHSEPAKDTTRKIVQFAPTEPLSTYLFSFVTGKFNRSEHKEGERSIHIYHRETEQQKTAQLDEIARQVFASLKWMENYTEIPYPFAKYDLIILPGFQYGGMEHTGATLYKNSTLFLPPHPTLAQELSRAQLIAHETAHMWFGDYVTMDWFSGVWIKEVFANFFAAQICRPLFPHVDFAVNDLNFYTAAYAEDRTQGTTSIQQELPNLKYAGLIYGNIIYQKSPVVMNMLYEKLGAENFRAAIREYLGTYAYSNASWDDLAEIFARHQPQTAAGTPQDMKAWSHYWIYGKGMPEVSIKEGRITGLAESMQPLQLDTIAGHLIPNLNGKFYGYIELDPRTLAYILENLYHPELAGNNLAKKSLLITLNENWLNGNLAGDKFLQALCGYMKAETDPQIFPMLLGYIASVSGRSLSDINHPSSPLQQYAERQLWEYASAPQNKRYATQAFRTLYGMAQSEELLDRIYHIWESENFSNASRIKTARYYLPHLSLNERDYTGMAYQLAVKLPLLPNGKEKPAPQEILGIQKERLSNPDTRREFEYISRGAVADTAVLDTLFNSLLSAENRHTEPWTQSLLGLLNHPLRQKHALKYIRPALEAMEDVQATGDIFFPKGWISGVLGGHHSKEAGAIVQEYLAAHPGLLPLLKNKIRQSACHLPQ